MEKFLYFMEESDGVFDGANDAMCRPVSSFRGFGIIADVDAIELHFDSMLGVGADIAAVDKVILACTDNKQKELMQDVINAINAPMISGDGKGMITVADDTNASYISSHITAVTSITVTAAA